jgi:erythronate-4-phosphate dehydrogenase
MDVALSTLLTHLPLSAPMQILFDENIPFGAEAFSTLGAARACPGRAMTNADVHDVDLLFVRSVTRVNAELLEGSRVKFVATATSGSDHIDGAYLARRDIPWCDAIGSNANSVAEYVVAALLELGARHDFTLAGKSVGVIGVGHVGSLVVEKAHALGMTVVLNDPPRQRAEADFPGVVLDEALQCDVVSVHVPLTKEGPDPTYHLLNADRLRALHPGTILVQSSRGAVTDCTALKNCLAARQELLTVLDVWEGEPAIDPELLELVDLGTSHIAGYSWTSKVLATAMIYHEACRVLGVSPAWTPPALPADTAATVIDLAGAPATDEDILRFAVRGVYDLAADDLRLRHLPSLPLGEQGTYFDRLRKQYPVRLEFPQAEIHNAPKESLGALQGLGFQSLRAT